MKLVMTIILSLSSWAVFSQNTQFSQYYASPIFLNPAFAGIIAEPTLSINHKNSGKINDGSFSDLSQLTLSMPYLTTTTKTLQSGGAALSVFREKRGFNGIYVTHKVLGAGAYSLRLDRLRPQYLTFGLQGGIVINSLDTGPLRWGSQYNPYIGFDDSLPQEDVTANSDAYPVFNFGMIYAVHNHDNIYVRDKSVVVGIAIDNLNVPKTNSGFGTTRESPVIRLHAASESEINPKTSVHPTLLLLYQSGSYQANVGIYWSRLVSNTLSKKSVLLQVGGWYRLNDSVIGTIGLEVESLRVGFSYDLNTRTFNNNDVTAQNNGALEVSISYRLQKSRSITKISNPLF
ncbi:MAG: PorP/SprF family type IX secretion system membrane protein [Cyclobacteriaceae bacterium]